MCLLLHDRYQVDAMPGYLDHYDLSEVIGVFRSDIYGQELMDEFLKVYAGSSDFISYDHKDLDPVDIVLQLEMLLIEYLDAVVLAASYEKKVDILGAIPGDSPLLKRR